MKTNKEAKTCPMCRAAWKTRRLSTAILPSKVGLESKALQLYIEWLYNDTLRVDPDVAPESDDYNLHLLQAWSVAVAAKDTTFERAIIAHLMSQFEQYRNAGFGPASVSYALLTVNNIHPPMRAFVKKVTLVWGMRDSLKQSRDTAAAMLRFEVQKSKEQIRRKILSEATDGEYSFEEPQRSWAADLSSRL